MTLLYQLITYLHIAAGATALFVCVAAFIAKKGSGAHAKWGQAFVKAMWIIGLTGLALSSIVWWDALGVKQISIESAEKAARITSEFRLFSEFLALLSVLSILSVKHGTLVLRAKADRSVLASVEHLFWFIALSILSVRVLYNGIQSGHPLFYIFPIISSFTIFGGLRYIFKKELKQREWIIEHISSMVGGSIAVYTAFAVFGGRKLFEDLLTGNLQIIPWVVPGIIGSILLQYYKRVAINRFKVLPQKIQAEEVQSKAA